MIIISYSLSVILVLCGFLFWYKNRKRNSSEYRLLPGPFAQPLIGNVLQIGYQPHMTFSKWAKEYGPIYQIKLGFEKAVVVSDYKLLKELFNDYASTGRQKDNPATLEFTRGSYGVLNTDGKHWEQQRKFVIRSLRNFGFAKTSMETMINDEVQSMMEWFIKSKGKSIPGTRIFNAPVVNSLWRIVTGERCEWEKCRPPILDAADEFFSASMNVATNGVLFIPVLRLLAPDYFGWNRYVKSVDTMLQLLENSIELHKSSFDKDKPRDFIDHFLLEIHNETDSESSFYKGVGYKNLVAGIFELFLAGSETTSNLLSWLLLYLSEFQEKQKKLQAEIDSVCGSRSPTLLDKASMPYTEAVITEILRMAAVIPFGFPHRMLEDRIFHGYHLEKETIIIGNFYGALHDPCVWRDPENFRPERFLDESETNFLANEAMVAFSEGKRRCLGETLGRDTLFLFVTNIFKKFNIMSDHKLEEKVSFEPAFGIILAPKPFNVVFHKRKENPMIV